MINIESIQNQEASKSGDLNTVTRYTILQEAQCIINYTINNNQYRLLF